MANIYNATPGTISQGVNDQSTRSVPFAAEDVPQKVDLYYLFAKKGGTDRFFGTISEARSKYGNETFDSNSKFFTHHTDMLNEIIGGSGSKCVIQRVVPSDAGVKANVAVYLDVLNTKIPNYKRNSNGQYFTDGDGRKVLDETTPYVDGKYIKWFTRSFKDEQDLGSIVVADGSMGKWDFEKENEVHLLSSDTNIDTVASGHLEYADKTVYTYATLEDMWAPSASTTRKKYTVDGLGARTDEGSDTFNGDKIVKSKIYPIFQVKASNQGEWYNLFGFGLTSLKTKEISQSVVKGLKSLPYKFSYYVKQDASSTAKPYKNLYSETSTQVAFCKDAIDPNTGLNLNFEYVTDDMYFNTTDASKNLNYDEVEKLYFYRENLEMILKDAIVLEAPYVTITPKTWADREDASTYSWYDFTTYNPVEILNEFGLLNPFTTTTSQAIPLFTLMYNDAPLTQEMVGFKEVNMVGGNPIMLEGGSDGTLSYEEYEKRISEDLDNYLDEEHIYQDQGVSVENFLWDSGFSLDIKKKIGNFIAKRHDRFVGYCTHYDSLGEKSLSLSEQTSLGITLYNNIKLNIESEEFATPTIRAIIVLGTGRKVNSKKRYPILIDVVKKISLLMGGNDRKWKSQYLFDSGEKNVINELIDIQPTFIPPAVRDSLVDNGITYPQHYGRTSYFFPATRTVYEDQTSIAVSLINMLAIPYCERVAYEVWREMTGTTSLTAPQFLREVKNRAMRKLAGAFGGIITPIPNATINDNDELLGYLWRLEITLSGNNQKTKQIYNTTLMRSALETK